MIQSATAFAGGFAAQGVLSSVRLPKIQQAGNKDETFKIAIRLIAASVPVLNKPGMLSRQRPFLEATLGAINKQTELGDFAASSSSSTAGKDFGDCPWRFDESLMFEVDHKDILGPGIRFRLRAHSDIQLGPFQLELKNSADIGEVVMSFEHRLLPACVHEKRDEQGHILCWESPVLLAPLSHMRGGLLNDDYCVGDSVAHIALVISVDADPEKLIAAADATRPVGSRAERAAQQIEEQANNVLRWFEAPVDFTWSTPSWLLKNAAVDSTKENSSPDSQESQGPSCPPNTIGPRPRLLAVNPKQLDDSTSAEGRCVAASEKLWEGPESNQCAQEMKALAHGKAAQERAVDAPKKPLKSPDLHPDGWVCRSGPHGQQYWHHLALGPAPWDVKPEFSLPPLMKAAHRAACTDSRSTEEFKNLARGPEDGSRSPRRPRERVVQSHHHASLPLIAAI